MSFLSRISLNRPLNSYGRLQALYASLVRGRKSQLTAAVRKKDYLNIGCGPSIVRGFINLDYSWCPGLDVCWDIQKGLPFESESMLGIFTEHCLEHIPQAACERVLRDCRRMLKPGRAIRIVVPDAELYLDLYQRAKAGEDVRFPYQDEAESTPMIVVNRVFRNFGHQFAYDEKTIVEMLRRTGFVDIRRTKFGEGRDPRLLIDREERAVESLYVEASKPR